MTLFAQPQAWAQGTGFQKLLNDINSSSIPDQQKRQLSCKVRVLEDLGWEFNQSSQVDHVYNDTSTGVCGNLDIKDSQRLLNINVPSSSTPMKGLSETLDQILQTQNSKCAYKYRLKLATQAAVKKIYENNNYAFYNPSEEPNCTFQKTQGWEIISAWGKVNDQINDQRYEIEYPQKKKLNSKQQEVFSDALRKYSFIVGASGSPLEAIRAIEQGSTAVATDCAIGLQYALLSAQKELYGDDDFDKAFKKEEIVVGDQEILSYGSNPFFGKDRPLIPGTQSCNSIDDEFQRILCVEQQQSKYSKEQAAQGPLALIGVDGYIGYTKTTGYRLDDSVNRGQNFVIDDMSNDAAAALARNGLSYYNDILAEVYQEHKNIVELVDKNNKEYELFYETAYDGHDAKEIRGVLGWANKKSSLDTIQYPTAERWGTNYADPNKISILKSFKRIAMLLDDPFLRQTQVAVHPNHYRFTLAYYALHQVKVNPRATPKIRFYSAAANSTLFERFVKFKQDSCMKK